MSSLCAKLFLIALAYFIAIKALVWVIFTLVIFDLITGIWKVVKLNGWKTLNSKGYKRTIIKMAAYFIALISVFLIEAEILGSGIFLCKIVAGMISLVELASIAENLTTITGQPIFMKIYDTLKTYFNTNKNIIDKIDTDKDEDIQNKQSTEQSQTNNTGSDGNN